LWLHERLLLAWYTGWAEVDIHAIVAHWAVAAARATGSGAIIFTGSSGGGFAALQTSAYVPGSIALAFNAQTDITEYRVNGESYGAQRTYLEIVWPEINAEVTSAAALRSASWGDPIRDRVSAVARYAHPVKNFVRVVQNKNEFHMDEHYKPFVTAMEGAGNGERLYTSLYEGGTTHNPPTEDVFEHELTEALVFARGHKGIGVC